MKTEKMSSGRELVVFYDERGQKNLHTFNRIAENGGDIDRALEEVFDHEYGSDCDRNMGTVIGTYTEASDSEKAIIDDIFISLCGWSISSLLGMTLKQYREESTSVMPFTVSDIEAVCRLDEKSGSCVSQWVKDLEPNEEQDYAYGIFVDDTLIGYCTLGYADDCPDIIDKHPEHTCDSLLLSDVFILDDFRQNGYGLTLVTEAIKAKVNKEAVFLQAMRPELTRFYEKAGFETVGESDAAGIVMIKHSKRV